MMARGPRSATAAVTARSTSAARLTSAWTPIARPPAAAIAAAVSRAEDSSMSTAATPAPRAASASAMARPRPEPAPVTTAARSLEVMRSPPRGAPEAGRGRGRSASPLEADHVRGERQRPLGVGLGLLQLPDDQGIAARLVGLLAELGLDLLEPGRRELRPPVIPGDLPDPVVRLGRLGPVEDLDRVGRPAGRIGLPDLPVLEPRGAAAQGDQADEQEQESVAPPSPGHASSPRLE